MSTVFDSKLTPDVQTAAPPKDAETAQQLDNPKLARFLDRLDREMGRNVSPVAAE